MHRSACKACEASLFAWVMAASLCAHMCECVCVCGGSPKALATSRSPMSGYAWVNSYVWDGRKYLQAGPSAPSLLRTQAWDRDVVVTES